MRRTLLLALPLFLAACVPGQQPAETDGEPVASVGEEFTMSLPAGWEEQADENAEFSAQNPKDDMYLTVLSESQADFDLDLATYAETVVGILVDNTAGEITSGPTPLKVDGHDAIRYEVRGTSDDVKLVYIDTVIKGDRDFHQLATFTLQSSYGANKAGMEALADGFKITGAPTE